MLKLSLFDDAKVRTKPDLCKFIQPTRQNLQRIRYGLVI